MMFLTSLALLCASLLSSAHAKASPSSTAPPPATSSTISQAGCPSQVSIINGGFESGKLAPWTSGYLGGQGTPVNTSIVSPGYQNSKYALELDFTDGNTYGFNVRQPLQGKVCWGYYYNISYAYNWVDYKGPEGYCNFKVYTGYTENENVTTINSTKKAGWHFNSYVARDEYSHCKSLGDTLFFNLDCNLYGNKTVPPFKLRLDHFNIQTLPYSPLPYPPSGGC